MTRDTWAKLPDKPKHKMAQLTTGELLRYRTALEQAQAEIPADSPDRDELEQELQKVKNEQASRGQPAGHRLRAGWGKPKMPDTAPNPNPPNPCHRPQCLITVRGVTYCDEGRNCPN
jgi:hypothetical protein